MWDLRCYSLSLSLSLTHIHTYTHALIFLWYTHTLIFLWYTHTHTHTHTHIYIYVCVYIYEITFFGMQPLLVSSVIILYLLLLSFFKNHHHHIGQTVQSNWRSLCPSLTIHPYRISLLTDSLYSIQCLQRVDVYMPTLAHTRIQDQGRSSRMSSSFLYQQFSVCLVCFRWFFFCRMQQKGFLQNSSWHSCAVPSRFFPCFF